MGKSRRGEYNGSNGRTLRAYYNPRRSYNTKPMTEGLVVRVVRNAGTLSSFERQQFTEEFTFQDELCGIIADDGSPKAQTVYYSLGKRSRWSLPEHLKLQALEGDPQLEGSEQGGRLTVVERFVHYEGIRRNLADCIAVTDSKAKVKVRTPTKTYSRFQELKENSEGPEVCYEFSYPYPTDSWPNCSESGSPGHDLWDRNWKRRHPGKARCKNKSVRSKGERWGMYNDRDLKTIAKKGFSDFPPSSRKKKAKLEKVQVVEPEKFKNLRETERIQHTTFELGTYIDNLIAGQETKKSPKASRGNITESPVKTFSKKAVIYVDAPPSASDSEEMLIAVPPVVFNPEPDFTTDLDINCDLNPTQLAQDWKEAYIEGASLPRKFAIDARSLLQSCDGNTNGQFCHLLFQEKSCNGTGCTVTSVSLVASSLADPEFSFEQSASDFHDQLQEKKKIQKLWSVRDVVNLGILTFIKHVTVTDNVQHSSTRNATPAPLEMLSSMFGWQSTSLSSTCAKVELRQSLDKIHTSSPADGFHADYICLATTQCGICCQELCEGGTVVPHTALNKCQHYFCNDCWEAHLKTQISMNTTTMLCPEYKCDCPVDSVTVMSIIPSWYNKYVCRRIDNTLEINQEWKRCPSDKCHRVIKATFPPGKGLKEAFPVACHCGALWCFTCRKQAHWPVTCEEARLFDEMTRTYWDSIQTKAKEMITSVLVRKCPKCHYPIEKHAGCNYMYCILCNTSFCWECMTPWDVHGDECQDKVKSEEMGLTLDTQTNRFLYYVNMVKRNTLAKHMPLVTHQKRDLQHLHTSVAFYRSLDPTTRYNLQRGQRKHCKGFLEDAQAAGTLEVLGSLWQFKFEAHFTLQGAAKLAAISSRIERQIGSTIHQLQFIVDRITDLQEEGLSMLVKETHPFRLCHLLECGKKCLYSTGRAISKRKC